VNITGRCTFSSTLMPSAMEVIANNTDSISYSTYDDDDDDERMNFNMA